MGWKITTNDNKYQIKYGNNANYANIENDVSYLTITSNKIFGFNNANPNPNYLLDINGITHINSNLLVDGNVYISCNLYTSNIIGYRYHNSSNILQLNNTFTNNYSNNIVEIYGKTSLYGKVYISSNKYTINNDSSHLLNIDGSLKATSIYGDGENIINLNASKITSGSISVSQGGTGITSITPGQLLFGGIDSESRGIMTQNANFKIDSGYLVASMSARNISADTLPVRHGGTGLDSCPQGRIIYGSSIFNDPLKTSPNFVYTESTNTLNVSNIEIRNELRFNKLKKLNSAGTEYNDLEPSDIGITPASETNYGTVILGSQIELIQGKLSIKALGIESELWGRGLPSTSNAIAFPREGANITEGRVGINIIRPNHILDVKGSINTSNGGFFIDGIPLMGQTGILSQAIYTANLIFAQQLFGSVNLIEGITIPGATPELNVIIPSILNSNQAILFRDVAADTPWKIKSSILGETIRSSDNSINSETFEVEYITGTQIARLNKVFISNTTDTNLTADIFNIAVKNETTGNQVKILNITKEGNLLVGTSGNAPSQKLEVKGNITATGYVRSYFSDNRLKTLTSNITDALDIIDSLNGFYYVPNEKAIQLGFEYENEIGLSAQDVQRVIPELVKIAPFDSTKINDKITSKSGEEYLTICYERLGAVFVEAIKELRKENKILKDEIVTIKKDLDNIKKIIYIQ
jgi:hypothetical protein